mmetsp:Transcript_11407/g.23002  ORF Transcript_11407/g.23002 Transcript_11407/m.23002 type:complete len:371 (-) Transcript_11407:782-1894(-)
MHSSASNASRCSSTSTPVRRAAPATCLLRTLAFADGCTDRVARRGEVTGEGGHGCSRRLAAQRVERQSAEAREQRPHLREPIGPLLCTQRRASSRLLSSGRLPSGGRRVHLASLGWEHVRRLELCQLTLRRPDDGSGEAGCLGHVDAKSLVARAILHTVEHRHRGVLDVRRDVTVDHRAVALRQLSELMEVGGEERTAAHLGDNVLGDGPREAEAVIGGSASAQLVDDHEGALGGTLEDGGRLEHLRHERRDATRLAITGAHARQDAISDGDLRLVARHERAHLRQQHIDPCRANVRRLATHVRAGDHLQRRLAADELDVILDEANALHALDTRVTASAQQHTLAGVLGGNQRGTYVGLRGGGGDVGKGE